MNWIDIFVIGTLLVSGAFAYARGLVHEVLSIAGWAGATLAALYATPMAEKFALQFIQDPFFATVATGIVLFVSTLVILSIITRRISRGVKASALGPLDRALGFVFGLARGAVVIAFVWVGYTWVTPTDEQPEWIYEARTIALITQGAEMLKTLAPATPAGISPNATPDDQKKTTPGEPTQSLFDRAINALPKPPGASDTSGYGKKERSEMDRLFETSK